MNLMLKLKHWQVFMILLVGSFASSFTWKDHELFNLGLNSVGCLIYLFWYFAIGLELTEYLLSRVQLSTTLFIVNAFVLIISMLIVVVFFDGYFSSNGLVGVIWIGYLMFAIFQFVFYPSKALRSVELQKEAAFSQYFGYFLLITFWPFGIWWIQPKLNKIAATGNHRLL